MKGTILLVLDSLWEHYNPLGINGQKSLWWPFYSCYSTSIRWGHIVHFVHSKNIWHFYSLRRFDIWKIYSRMGVAQLFGIFVVLVAIRVEASPFAKKVSLSIRFFHFWTFTRTFDFNESITSSINQSWFLTSVLCLLVLFLPSSILYLLFTCIPIRQIKRN